MCELVCKKCGGLLEEGEIFANNCHRIRWFPKQLDAPFLFTNPFKKNQMSKGIRFITSDSVFSVIQKKAYYCKNCNSIIVKCDED